MWTRYNLILQNAVYEKKLIQIPKDHFYNITCLKKKKILHKHAEEFLKAKSKPKEHATKTK